MNSRGNVLFESNIINGKTNPFHSVRWAKKQKKLAADQLKEYLDSELITEEEYNAQLEELESTEGYWRGINGLIPYKNEAGGKSNSSIYKWFGLILFAGGVASVILKNPFTFYAFACAVLGIIAILGNRIATTGRVVVCLTVMYLFMGISFYRLMEEGFVFFIPGIVGMGIFAFLTMGRGSHPGGYKSAVRIVFSVIAILCLAVLPVMLLYSMFMSGRLWLGYASILPACQCIAVAVICISQCIVGDGFGEENDASLDCAFMKLLKRDEVQTKIFAGIGIAIAIIICVALLRGCVSFIHDATAGEDNTEYLDMNGNGQMDDGEFFRYEHIDPDGNVTYDYDQ